MSGCPYSTKKVTYLIPLKELSTDEDFLTIHTWLAKMRKESPIRFDVNRQCWDVFLFKDIEEIFRNHRSFSSVRNFHTRTPLRSILNMDPPEHTNMRKLVSKAFTAKSLQILEPRIRERTNHLLDSALARGSVDIVNEFAYPLTIHMLVHLLGVPEKDSDLFKVWAADLTAAPKDDTENSYSTAVSHLEQTMKEVTGYLQNIINERKQHPQEDLISDLVQAEIDGESLTDEEILDFAVILLTAGFGTTARLISNSVRCMIENPGLLEQLQEDSSLIPDALEEVLRLYPSIYRTTRYAKEDIELNGVKLSAGDEIQIWMASANRDESMFDNPNDFIINRKPNLHLAFGKGIHFCLGSSLARLEAKIALEIFVNKVKSIELADERLIPIRSMVANGLEQLKINIHS